MPTGRRHRSSRPVSVWIIVLAVAGLVACGAEASLVVDVSELVRPLPDSVSDWTVTDVEVWVNRTLGYPEYSAVVRKHLVDGPTLVRLNLEEAFSPRHPIHLTKMQAHVDKLRGSSCLAAVHDFWSYYNAHGTQVLRLGSTLVFTPRLGLAYIFLYDGMAYNSLMAPSVSTSAALESVHEDGSADSLVPWVSTIFFLVTGITVPYFLLTVKMLPLLSAHWIILTPIMTALITKQLAEWLAFIVMGPRQALKTAFGFIDMACLALFFVVAETEVFGVGQLLIWGLAVLAAYNTFSVAITCIALASKFAQWRKEKKDSEGQAAGAEQTSGAQQQKRSR